jgi:hypothetical protein
LCLICFFNLLLYLILILFLWLRLYWIINLWLWFYDLWFDLVLNFSLIFSFNFIESNHLIKICWLRLWNINVFESFLRLFYHFWSILWLRFFTNMITIMNHLVFVSSCISFFLLRKYLFLNIHRCARTHVI